MKVTLVPPDASCISHDNYLASVSYNNSIILAGKSDKIKFITNILTSQTPYQYFDHILEFKKLSDPQSPLTFCIIGKNTSIIKTLMKYINYMIPEFPQFKIIDMSNDNTISSIIITNDGFYRYHNVTQIIALSGFPLIYDVTQLQQVLYNVSMCNYMITDESDDESWEMM